ncbi:hypothetical protein RIF29_40194 [Crotalaria pallida]|uniref:F-box associated beta-propeller type 1 domain-containing protein n=1 Tax=Crotalaria pallida TaxID=3830 RepID=A0AAN9HQF5_CROPI
MDNTYVSTSLNPGFPPPSGFDIIGSCRGFLLLNNIFEYLYIWNPSTNVRKVLPSSPIVASNPHMPGLYGTTLYGFGYDPSKDDYLVVLATHDPALDHSIDFTNICFELFSLRANAWKQFEVTDLPYNVFGGTSFGTLLNWILHWLAYRPDAIVILAFDLVERKFSEVCLPDDFNPEGRFCDLCVLGGFLSLSIAEGDTTEIWVMEKYNEQSSWTKSFALSNNDLPSPSQHFSPIFSTKSGDIVGFNGRARLVKCNANGQLLEHCSYRDDPRGFGGGYV